MQVRRLLVAVLAVGTLSCEIRQVNKVVPNEEQVKTDLFKIYNNEQDYITGKDWNTMLELRKELAKPENPKLIVITQAPCAKSMLLHRQIRKSNLRDQVQILDLKEEWVYRLLLGVEDLERVPALIVFWENGPHKLKVVHEPHEIIRKVRYWSVRKNRQQKK